MILFRPVQASDLQAILAIAAEAGAGFNFLPNHDKAMEAKIAWSLKSFADTTTSDHPKFYFFVLENIETQEIIGTAGIEDHIGNPWPFYKFKVSSIVQTSRSLGSIQKHRILQIVTEHENASELGALYLKPAYRGEGRGTFLSRARCLFIAQFQHLFSDKIIADLRGVSNKDEVSPFWEALGRHFFGMTYAKAAHLKSIEGSQFLIDLMPHHPIYVELLSENAQNVIGKTHDESSPARYVLEKEGFQFRNHIDIFDGGPTIEVAKNKMKTVYESKQVFVETFKKEINSSQKMMLCNTKRDYRATLGTIEFTASGTAILERDVAARLNIAMGDLIRYCPL